MFVEWMIKVKKYTNPDLNPTLEDFWKTFLEITAFQNTKKNLENMHAAETEKANAGEFKKIEIAIFVMKKWLW